MKHIITFIPIVIIGLFIFSSCKDKVAVSQDYTVEGVVDTALNGKQVYMTDYSTRLKIDSTLVDSGKFVFNGLADTVRFCRVSVDRQYANIILEGGIITVDMKKHSASGTPLNKTFAEFSQKSDSLRRLSYENYTKLKEQITDPKELNFKADSMYKADVRPLIDDLVNKTFEANTNNIIGMIAAGEMSMSSSIGRMDTVFSQLSPDIREMKMVKDMIERNETLKKTAVGQKFVDFTITQKDSTKVSLSDYAGKGKYVLVDFWASWCGPCRAEVPNLKEIYSNHKGDKFEIVGVAVWDELERTEKAIEDDKIPWPQIINAGEIPTKLYGINGIPHIILIGPDGTILERHLRGEDMKNMIAKLLAE